LEEEDGLRFTLDLLQTLEQKSRLPHSRFGDQRQKSAVRFNAVPQRSQRLPVAFARVEVARIRCYAERLFSQAIEIEHHGSPTLCSAWASRPPPAGPVLRLPVAGCGTRNPRNPPRKRS